MKISDVNILNEKAKSRKDGVYCYKGIYWAVKDKKFIAYADLFGSCFKRMGAFDCKIGEADRIDRKRKLVEWLKSQ